MTQQKQCVATFRDPKGTKQHYWRTGAKENHPTGPRTDMKSADLDHLNNVMML